MRLPVCIGAFIAAAVVLLGSSGDELLAHSPQAAAEERRFEVASVKPGLSPAEIGRRAAEASASGNFAIPFMGARTEPGGRFLGNATLKQLVVYAFDVRDYQVEGGPKWLTTDYFDVKAVAGFDATAVEMRGLVRALLAERFGFRSHTDTRQAPVYALTLARSDGRLGPRLKPTTPECLQQLEQRKKGAVVPPTPPPSARDFSNQTPRCGTTMMMTRAGGALTMLMGGMDLTSLVRQISSEVAAPVVDQTGLTGLYDITLEYASERINVGGGRGLDPNGTDTPPLPLMPAVQQQLGLKLEKQIGPMPVVVIDAAELPTAD